MRHPFRPLLTLTLTLTLGLAAAAAKPNLLLFMSDDLSYHDLSVSGNPDVNSPHLDQFATEGVLFRQAYNSSPMCAPTRMSLYTGLHPVRHGGYPNHSRVYPGIRSLPSYLRDSGYAVALLGKRHEKPLDQFDFTNLGGRHHDDGEGLDLDTTAAGRFIADHADQSWCLVVTSNQPHTPWNRGDASAYDPATLTVPPYLVDTLATREALTHYYAEITYMDAQFGRVMAELAAHGDPANTVVVYLTEQGSNFPFCKWTCYETGLRSTAIVRWPGQIPASVASDALIQYVDIVPTFIALAGGDPTVFNLDGRPLVDLWRDPTRASPHRYIFGLQTTRGIARGGEAYAIRTVRDERYRLIWNLHADTAFANTVTHGFLPYLSWAQVPADGNDQAAFAADRYDAYRHRPALELYDLQNDPWELHNLAADPGLADRRDELHAALRAWMAQQGDCGDATERAAFTRMPGRQ